jgi:hypothetical protein
MILPSFPEFLNNNPNTYISNPNVLKSISIFSLFKRGRLRVLISAASILLLSSLPWREYAAMTYIYQRRINFCIISELEITFLKCLQHLPLIHMDICSNLKSLTPSQLGGFPKYLNSHVCSIDFSYSTISQFCSLQKRRRNLIVITFHMIKTLAQFNEYKCNERYRSHEWRKCGFEVLTRVIIKSTISLDVTRCSPVHVHRRFGGTYYLYLQGRTVS